MKHPLLLAAAVIALAGCASGGSGQPQAAPSQAARGERFPNPVTLLIQARDSLGLDELQVGAMQRIEQDVRQQNEPLVRELPQRPAGGRGPGVGPGGGMGGPGGGRGGRGGPGGGDMGRMRETMTKIEQNNQRALEQVYRLLTPEQTEQARAWIEAHRPRRGPRGEQGPRGEPGQRP